MNVTLAERAAFAAWVYDVGTEEVVLGSDVHAVAVLRAAPALGETPDIRTPWIRAREWATAHLDAPVAPPDRRAKLGSLAEPFIASKKKTKLRLDRVQDAWVRANGRTPVKAHIVTVHGELVRVKDLVRKAREAVKPSADDGKRVAAALIEAWLRSDVELVRSP